MIRHHDGAGHRRSAGILTAALLASGALALAASACSSTEDAPPGSAPPSDAATDGGAEGASDDVAQCEQTLCSGACVNTWSDSKNCGACERACNSNEACRGGICVVACAEGQESCGDRCLDIRSDVKNCGACGRECPSGQSCAGGACTCADVNLVSCEGTCIDPKKDKKYCGAVAGCGVNAGYAGSLCTSNGYCGEGVCRTCSTWTAGQAIVLANKPTAVDLADFNGDGELDLAVTVEDAAGTVNELSVFRGLGSGAFQVPGVTYATGKRPAALAIGDVNSDGKLDIVTADWFGRSATVFTGNGDGTFQPTTVALPPHRSPQGYNVYPFPRSVAIGDLDGDGRGDIVVGCGDPRVILSKSNGTFEVQSRLEISASAVALADMNGDGHLDLVTGSSGLGGTSVALGDGAGQFTVKQRLSVQIGGGGLVNVVDTDGDGKLDVIVDGTQWFYRLYRGNGDGTLASAPVHIPIAQVATAGSDLPEAMYFRDVTGDGLADILTVTSSGKMYIRAGAADGSFHPAEESSVGSSASALALTDFNGDAAVDFVVADYEGSQVRIAFGARSSATECR